MSTITVPVRPSPEKICQELFGSSEVKEAVANKDVFTLEILFARALREDRFREREIATAKIEGARKSLFLRSLDTERSMATMSFTTADRAASEELAKAAAAIRE